MIAMMHEPKHRSAWWMKAALPLLRDDLICHLVQWRRRNMPALASVHLSSGSVKAEENARLDACSSVISFSEGTGRCPPWRLFICHHIQWRRRKMPALTPVHLPSHSVKAQEDACLGTCSSVISFSEGGGRYPPWQLFICHLVQWRRRKTPALTPVHLSSRSVKAEEDARLDACSSVISFSEGRGRCPPWHLFICHHVQWRRRKMPALMPVHLSSHSVKADEDARLDACSSVISFSEGGGGCPPWCLFICHLIQWRRRKMPVLAPVHLRSHSVKAEEDAHLDDCSSVISFSENGGKCLPWHLFICHLIQWRRRRMPTLTPVHLPSRSVKAEEDARLDTCSSVISFSEGAGRCPPWHLFICDLIQWRRRKMPALTIVHLSSRSVKAEEDACLDTCSSVISFSEGGGRCLPWHLFICHLVQWRRRKMPALTPVHLSSRSVKAQEHARLDACSSVITFSEGRGRCPPWHLFICHLVQWRRRKMPALTPVHLSSHSVKVEEDARLDTCSSVISFSEGGGRCPTWHLFICHLVQWRRRKMPALTPVHLSSRSVKAGIPVYRSSARWLDRHLSNRVHKMVPGLPIFSWMVGSHLSYRVVPVYRSSDMSSFAVINPDFSSEAGPYPGYSESKKGCFIMDQSPGTAPLHFPEACSARVQWVPNPTCPDDRNDFLWWERHTEHININT